MLLVGVSRGGEKLRGHEPLDEVVVAPAPVTAGDSQPADDEECLHHRLGGAGIGRAAGVPPPLDAMLDVAEGIGRKLAVALDASQDGCGQLSMLT